MLKDRTSVPYFRRFYFQKDDIIFFQIIVFRVSSSRKCHFGLKFRLVFEHRVLPLLKVGRIFRGLPFVIGCHPKEIQDSRGDSLRQSPSKNFRFKRPHPRCITLKNFRFEIRKVTPLGSS